MFLVARDDEEDVDEKGADGDDAHPILEKKPGNQVKFRGILISLCVMTLGHALKPSWS